MDNYTNIPDGKFAVQRRPDPMTHTEQAERIRQQLAENYAAAEPSDPFLAARIATHMRNGLAGPRQMEPFENADYRATVGYETRSYSTADGPREYQVRVYTNRARP